MTTQPQIRRRTDGTIDIDFYRNHALMLRRETRTNVCRAIGPASRSMLAVAVAALVRILKAEPRGSVTIDIAVQTR